MTNEATEVSPAHPDEAVSDNVSPESEAPALIEDLNRDSGCAVSVVDTHGKREHRHDHNRRDSRVSC